MSVGLPSWAAAKLGFDRFVDLEPGEDPFLADVQALIAEGEFSDLFDFLPVATTRSSIELLLERRTGKALLLWDLDCLDRIDGLLALILADDGHSREGYHRLGVIALCELLASMFIVTDPGVTMEIMTMREAFQPDDIMVTVEDDAQLDRFRRLVRVYLFHHELGHLIYAIGEHVLPDVGIMIEDALRHFSLAEPSNAPVERSASADRLVERGLTIPYDQIAGLEAEIRDQLAHPGTREETWCDGFAIRRLVDWAVRNDIPVEECYAVDVLLHLFVGARLQWYGFWSPRNTEQPWDAIPILSQHQARVHVRGLIFVAEAFRAWRGAQPETDASTEMLFAAFEKARDGLTDPLIERFYDRFDFALGLPHHYDRAEVLARCAADWRALSEAEQEQAISDILYDLQHLDD